MGNNMITEDYVSFETAKLLKEKGFDAKCRALYTFWFDEDVEGPKEDRAENWNVEQRYFSAPTLQMVMKWLREVHHINIEIITYWTKDKSMVYGNRMVHNNAVLKEIDIAYNSYEQACEAAIKYCLENLI